MIDLRRMLTAYVYAKSNLSEVINSTGSPYDHDLERLFNNRQAVSV